MTKRHIKTYRPGPYIFIENGEVLIDDKDKVYIRARYREYNSVTIAGMIRPRTRQKTFSVDFENRCLTYKNEVYVVKNLNEVFQFLAESGFDDRIRGDFADLQLIE